MKRVAFLITLCVSLSFFAGCEKKLPDNLKGEIAFVSSMENDGAHDIYVITLPSKEVRQLTKTSGQDVENMYLDWCPTGQIAFASTRDRNYELYLINPDGSGETRLTKNDYDDLYPAMRWDGKQIAYSSTILTSRGLPEKDIFIMDLATKKTERITNTPEDEVSLRWSPDGKKLAYSRYVMGQSEIFVYDFASKKSLQLTDNPAEDVNPTWTPDSKYIVFSSTRLDSVNIGEDKLYSIFAMNAEDGSNVSTLLDDSKDGYSVGNPSISPDGLWLAYQYKHKDWDYMYIAVRRVDGKEDYTIVKNIYYNRNPVWNPMPPK
jgi:TolB protein